MGPPLEARGVRRRYLWHEHFDPWIWYTERLPSWVSALLPILLAPAPILLALLVQPQVTRDVWQVLTSTILGLHFGVAVGLAQGFYEWFLLVCILWIQLLFLVWIVRNLELMRQGEKIEASLQRKEAHAAEAQAKRQALRRLGLLVVIGLLRAARGLDRFLRKQETKAAEAYNRRHWLRRFHFIGLTFFIFLPVGSGLITGVFVGKLTGMSDRRLVAAIFLGTVLWAALLVYVGDVIGDAIRRAVDEFAARS